MTRQERILSYSKGYDKLIASLDEFPKEMWQYKHAPDKWSIHEILIHMADSEANSFSRARKIICESGSTIMVYDQDKWASETDYHKQSTEDALELFKWLRKMTYNIIKDLPEESWQNYIQHPERGKMTLDEWLIVYEEHVQVHINQMKRNFKEWNKSNN
ncbi:MAG: DinB family protein [Ignavibacteriales bacterium]|nr:DinB family protein [Ignavibacteriales bacterium]